MIVQETPASLSVEAFESLAALQQLTLEAGLSENHKQLTFRILNRSIGYCRYDRAVLWKITGRSVKLLGVSGHAAVNPRSALVCEWRGVLTAMKDRHRPAIIDRDAFAADSGVWQRLAQRTRGLSVVWLPIRVEGRTVAGLWLERWGGRRFDPSDLTRLEALALAYGVAWRSVTRTANPLLSWLRSRKRAAAGLCAALLVMGCCFIRLPLRIVAPCEVVPKDPVVVAAPLNGVIDEIVVLPGRRVAAGDLLAKYDTRVAREELKVAQEQVRIIDSDLRRARVQAFEDASARAQIALLENRLEQERTRLRIAQHRVDLLELRAPVDGVSMLDDPHQWRGRPVQVGERLMMIVKPAETKLRIWLPEHDNIAFDRQKPLNVLLDSDPSSSRKANLRFVANHSRMSSRNTPGFRAEADWIDCQPDVKLGLQGTAVLYGEDVPLGYWLLRRPLAAVRRFFGI